MDVDLIQIHKHYGTVKANNGVSLAVRSGTIHGVLGENGAGKSTLMKVLAGYIAKTSGSIRIDGKTVSYHTPAAAAALGIGMLYQDPLDFPQLSVLENFRLGLQRAGKLRGIGVADQLTRLCDQFGFQLFPHAPLAQLTVGERQQLELIRLIALGVSLLILDEPTTGISSRQKNVLFNALKKLASRNKSVLLVSHKLEDTEALCDHVTVLRQGQVTGDMDQPFDTRRLLAMMFDQLPDPPCGIEPPTGDTALAFDRVVGTGGRAGLAECSATVRQGEIVALAGLEGSGQGIFLRTAAGLQQPVSGQVVIDGNGMAGQDFEKFRKAGVTFLPTARLEEGLVAGLSVREHFALQDPQPGFFVDWAQAEQMAEDKINRFRIVARPEAPVESLSGGNQQRLLLSFMPEHPRLLLLENPTRGLDLESAHWVWRHLQQFCRQGTGIVFSSAELDEIMMVAHRVLVFFNGRLVKNVRTCDTSQQALGQAIAGKVEVPT